MQNRMKSTAIALLMIAPAVAMSAHAADTYHFGTAGQRTNITFQSETDFETILGSSNELKGTAMADFAKGTAHVDLRVPVESLRTGIDMRDEHLRSPMWLDAGKHPEITFVSHDATKAGKDLWKVKGTLSLHGVSKEVVTTVEVRQIPAATAKQAGLEAGDWIRISVPLEIKLSEFGVQIPEMAAAKVNDLWQVKVLAFANTPTGPTTAPASGGKGGNPCGR